ncbi:MAG: hypothetical protein ACK4UN_00310 [Limisphaerales bacterium]
MKFSEMGACDAHSLRQICPLPELLKRLGLGKHAKKSCKSPLREDSKASWGVFQKNDRWYYKDHGTGDAGDEIRFLARLKGLDEKADFQKLVSIWSELSLLPDSARDVSSKCVNKAEPTVLPDRSGFRAGTDSQLAELSKQRGISCDALELASERGFLVFGVWRGLECYGITDSSGIVLELRRVDGQLFPGIGELQPRKSHAVKNSRKSWPVGILESSSSESVVITEGIPDFLAAHQIMLVEGSVDRVAPVAFLSACCNIDKQVIQRFVGKHVRIIPHIDQAGLKGAEKWCQQLIEAGVAKVDLFDLSRFSHPDGKQIKDLCDFKDLHKKNFGTNPNDWRVLP